MNVKSKILIVISCLLLSCSKDDTKHYGPRLLLDKYISEYQTTVYEYNNDNELVKFTNYRDGAFRESVTFTKNKNKTITYQCVAVHNSDIVRCDSVTYDYSKRTITGWHEMFGKHVIYLDKNLRDSVWVRYSYLTKIETGFTYSQFPSDSIRYEYPNPTTKVSNYYNGNQELIGYTTETYDNNPDPHHNWSNYSGHANMGNLLYSRTEILKPDEEYIQYLLQESTATYLYDYNRQGYPTKKYFKNGADKGLIATYTYKFAN